MSDDDIKDIEFPGLGPFATPLLNRFVSLEMSDHPTVAILQCKFEDGVTVHLPITNQAASAMAQALNHWIARLAETEAADKTKH